MKKLYFLFTAMFLVFQSGYAEEYEFVGQHFLGSYYDCDVEAILNIEKLEEVMKEAVIATGAGVLDSTYYEFPNHGFSMVILLSESHASIHTYPEYNACFVDVFTCGNNCILKNFDQILSEYLKPQKTNIKIIERS